MSIPVLDVVLTYPVRRHRKTDTRRLDMGVGYTKTAEKTIAQSRADGKGTISSYKGQNIFTISITRKHFDGDGKFKTILGFLQQRIDNGREPFYFYHASERTTPDPTGADTTGRYKVKFLGEIEDVLTNLKRHDFTDIVLEESFF